MELSKYQRLKIQRESMNLSQKDVADALEMTSGGYSQIEKGKIKLTDSHLETLKSKLNFDLNYILNGETEAKETPSDSTPPAWAKELLHKIDKLIELQIANNAKDKTMLDLLGKHLGNQFTYSELKEMTGKIINFNTDSVTHAAKRAA